MIFYIFKWTRQDFRNWKFRILGQVNKLTSTVFERAESNYIYISHNVVFYLQI